MEEVENCPSLERSNLSCPPRIANDDYKRQKHWLREQKVIKSKNPVKVGKSRHMLKRKFFKLKMSRDKRAASAPSRHFSEESKED